MRPCWDRVGGHLPRPWLTGTQARPGAPSRSFVARHICFFIHALRDPSRARVVVVTPLEGAQCDVHEASREAPAVPRRPRHSSIYLNMRHLGVGLWRPRPTQLRALVVSICTLRSFCACCVSLLVWSFCRAVSLRDTARGGVRDMRPHHI